jgi:hypothetical membrane protein
MPLIRLTSRSSADNRSKMRLTLRECGALLWICCLQFFLAERLTSHVWWLPYSYSRNYISDLGALHCHSLICSPRHALMNGSFVLQGLLIALGAMLSWSAFRGLAKIGLGLLLISGLGVLLVGLVPEDSNTSLHTAGAAAHFLAGGLGIGVIGASSLLRRWKESIGWISLLVALVVLGATALAGGSDASTWQLLGGIGTIERIAAYGIILWLVTAGITNWTTMR